MNLKPLGRKYVHCTVSEPLKSSQFPNLRTATNTNNIKRKGKWIWQQLQFYQNFPKRTNSGVITEGNTDSQAVTSFHPMRRHTPFVHKMVTIYTMQLRFHLINYHHISARDVSKQTLCNLLCWSDQSFLVLIHFNYINLLANLEKKIYSKFHMSPSEAR